MTLSSYSYAAPRPCVYPVNGLSLSHNPIYVGLTAHDVKCLMKEREQQIYNVLEHGQFLVHTKMNCFVNECIATDVRKIFNTAKVSGATSCCA